MTTIVAAIVALATLGVVSGIDAAGAHTESGVAGSVPSATKPKRGGSVTYGLEAETSGQNGDAKAENLTVDSTLQIEVQNVGAGTPVTFKKLPAIKFSPDGTVDEDSPQILKLTDSAGFSRWLGLNSGRTGYEIRDSQN